MECSENFKTVDNFRDNGGYSCPGKKEICWGMIHRSADFSRISSGDHRIIINLLVDPAIYPVVIHCGQGKDRTGVVIASLLWLLGVDEPDITRDYLLSNNVVNLFECVKPEYIDNLYDFLHKSRNCGVSENTLVQLQRLLLR